AIGGLAVWLPTFLVQARGFGLAEATWRVGLVTLAASITGMSAGGWLADRLGRRHPRALFLIPGLALLGSIPFILVGIFGRALAAIGAVPTRYRDNPPENWTAALLVVVPAVLLAGIVLLCGARHLPREMALMLAKLKATPKAGAAATTQ